MLEFMRQEATRSRAIELVVPAVRRLDGLTVYPFDIGGGWLEAPGVMEADAARARTNAEGRLAHMRWILWEMGMAAHGVVTVGDPFIQILNTVKNLGCSLVAVASPGGRLEHWSARHLSRRLAREVPTRLLDDRSARPLARGRSLAMGATSSL